jgi:hypothetical protein
MFEATALAEKLRERLLVSRVHMMMNEVNEIKMNLPLQRRHPSMRMARQLAAGALLAVGIAGLVAVHAAVQSSAESAVSAAVETVDAASAEQAVQPAGRRRQTLSPLDRRVALLGQELKLDDGQRAKVKLLLQSQSAQVSHVWDDASIPSALRVKSTQTIGERTADQIRALLNDEQRKKYIQPRQHDAKVGAAAVDVESWMNKGNAK